MESISEVLARKFKEVELIENEWEIFDCFNVSPKSLVDKFFFKYIKAKINNDYDKFDKVEVLKSKISPIAEMLFQNIILNKLKTIKPYDSEIRVSKKMGLEYISDNHLSSENSTMNLLYSVLEEVCKQAIQVKGTKGDDRFIYNFRLFNYLANERSCFYLGINRESLNTLLEMK